MNKLSSKLRRLFPAIMSIDYEQRAGCIAFQVEQYRFGGRHSAKAQHKLWLHAFNKGVDAQERIVTGKYHGLIVNSAAQL